MVTPFFSSKMITNKSSHQNQHVLHYKKCNVIIFHRVMLEKLLPVKRFQ